MQSTISCLCASLLVVAATVKHQLILLAEGNDFLPALPALDIRAGAIDQLLGSYRQLLQTGVLVCLVGLDNCTLQQQTLSVALVGLDNSSLSG